MTFLHRTRSFITTPKENTNGIHKPLPLLPGPTACAFAAVENVPIPRRRTTTTPTRTLMHRVSLIFRPSPRKKGRRPPNLTLATNNNGSVLNSSRSSSLTSIAESEDDIRPPSGLGSPVSISSLPPSPFTPAHDENSPFCHRESIGGESVYQRTRAISSPNLLRTISVKLKAKTHLRRASVVPGQGGGMDIIPLVKPTTTRVLRSFNLPAEVIAVIISYLPRHAVAPLAPLSRSFSDAVRLALYTTLDLQTLRPLQLEKLVAALASRPDLTELVHHFICRTWPSFFSSSSASVSPHASVDDHRNSLLTATFTLALQRMSNLISLTLPAFNPSLLAHHTAFGLQRLTFLNATMSAQETTALFAWLDGQINIYILKFPNLQDSPITPVSVSDLSNPPSKHHYPVPPRTPVKSQSRPNSAFLSVSPGFSSPSATPTPHSSYFPPLLTSPFSSQTLLPNLTTLHGTPSLVHFLSPPSSSSSSMCPQRPLRSVSLTINTTLYTGLRPAALMVALQMQGVRRLGLRFVCESVDRRTVEKVLGAVGAVLGSPPQIGGEGEGEEGTEGGGEGTQGGNENVHGWRGLRVLEVEFQGESTDFSPEEALYKTLQATLPRYKALRDLHLRFDSFETEDDAFTPPSPLPHLPFPSPPSSSHSHHVPFPTQNASFSFPSQYVAFPTSLSSPSPSPRSPITPSRTHPPFQPPSPSSLEQARINMWLKQCPSLRSILLFSGASWQRPWDVGDGDDEDEEGVSEDGIPWSAVGLAQ